MECKCKIDLLEHNEILKAEYEKFVSQRPVNALINASKVLINAHNRPDMLNIIFFHETSSLFEEHLKIPYQFALALSQEVFTCCLCTYNADEVKAWMEERFDERYVARCLWSHPLVNSVKRMSQEETHA